MKPWLPRRGIARRKTSSNWPVRVSPRPGRQSPTARPPDRKSSSRRTYRETLSRRSSNRTLKRLPPRRWAGPVVVAIVVEDAVDADLLPLWDPRQAAEDVLEHG